MTLEQIKKLNEKTKYIVNKTKPIIKEKNNIQNEKMVFTDGSCFNKNRAGCGIFFSDYNRLNKSFPLKLEKKTNNTAELMAILKCLHILDENNMCNYTIYSDSEYSIKSVTMWYKKWQKNGQKLIS